MLEYFAAAVGRLSHGTVRVQIAWPAGRNQPAFGEAMAARSVEAGTAQLGWVPSRAWDEVGVTSFEALQTPFLITSQELMARIATGQVGARALDGLDAHGLVGLALVPDQPRYPGGVSHAFTSLRSFAGARVLDVPSKVSDRLLVALGAQPVHLDAGMARDRALARHTLDGYLDAPFTVPPDGVRVITANLVVDPRFNTLVANAAAFQRLSNDQRAALRTAASQTLRHAVATTPTEETAAAQFCISAGLVAIATPAQRQALRRASRPVITALERSPDTALMIRHIRRLASLLPPGAVFVPPAPCTRPLAGAPKGTARSPSILNGTYHWTVTKAEALRTLTKAELPDALPGLPAVNKIVLQDGKWIFPGGTDHANGTYSIVGNYFIFRGGGGPRPNMFTFTRSADGTLHLTPVLPMDPGDQFVLTGGGRSPWHRVGPPIVDLR